MITTEQAIQLVIENSYVHSLLIIIGSVIAAKLSIWIARKILLRLTQKTKTKIDDLIIAKTSLPLSMIIVLMGIRLAIIPLGPSETAAKIAYYSIGSLIIAITTYIAMVVFDVLIDEWGRKWAAKTKSAVDAQLISLFHRFSKIIIVIIGFMFILSLWGVQILPLVASLGIAGVAVAFALQNTLGNIFGGMSLILDKSIKTGDVIKIDQDTKGRVIDVGLRSTKIKTFNNEVIIIPNGKLADSRIQNYILPEPSIRIELPFGVEYGSDVDDVKKIVLNEIRKLGNVLKEPEPKVMFLEMGDFALRFTAYFWVSSFDEKFDTKEKANCMIYNALNKAKIGIPFPKDC